VPHADNPLLYFGNDLHDPLNDVCLLLYDKETEEESERELFVVPNLLDDLLPDGFGNGDSIVNFDLVDS